MTSQSYDMRTTYTHIYVNNYLRKLLKQYQFFYPTNVTIRSYKMELSYLDSQFWLTREGNTNKDKKQYHTYLSVVTFWYTLSSATETKNNWEPP